MADNGSYEYLRKLDELLTVIRIKKMNAIIKYGPSVAAHWKRR